MNPTKEFPPIEFPGSRAIAEAADDSIMKTDPWQPCRSKQLLFLGVHQNFGTKTHLLFTPSMCMCAGVISKCTIVYVSLLQLYILQIHICKKKTAFAKAPEWPDIFIVKSC